MSLSDVAPTVLLVMPLTDLERRVLDFERLFWKHRGSKTQAIKDHFDLSDVRYHQLLNALIDRPAAVEHDPMTVNRLRRLRAQRRWQRSA